MSIISQKKNVDVLYMSKRLPKNLITPNPKSAYGKKNIRRQFEIKGGKNERKNVLIVAKSQGYNGNRIDSAYRYLRDVLDVVLEGEREEFREAKRQTIRIRNQVNQFVNQELDDLDIDISNKNELIELISGLSPEDKVLLTVDNFVYTLNVDTSQRLLDNIDILFGDVEADDYGSDSDLIAKVKIVKSINISRLKSKKIKKGGAFFHYEHNLDVNLFDDQVFKFDEFKASYVKENCLVQSLINAGVEDSKVSMVRRLCRTRDIPVCKLKVICGCSKLHLSIHYIKSDDTRVEHYGDRSLPEIKLGNIKSHYFYIRPVLMTTYALKHYDERGDDPKWHAKLSSKEYVPKKELKNVNWVREEKNGNKIKKTKWGTNFDVIKWLVLRNDETLLRKITNTTEMLASQYHNKNKELLLEKKLQNIPTLDYPYEVKENENGKLEEYGAVSSYKNKYYNPKETKKWKIEIGTKGEKKLYRNKTMITIAFDFETNTDGKHSAYQVRAYDGTQYFEYEGEDSGKQLLNGLCSKYANKNVKKCPKGKYDVIKLIAHNAGYDTKFIFQYLDAFSNIERGSMMLCAEGNYNWFGTSVEIKIQDSYSFIAMPLSKFSKTFKIDSEKEIMPYSLMNKKQDKYIFTVKECDDAVKYQYRCENIGINKRNDEKEKKYLDAFYANVDKCGARIDDDSIDMRKYSGYYCKMDCKVLYEGWTTFRKWIMEITDLDTEYYVSLPSIANAYLTKEGCYRGVYQLGQQVREFTQLAMIGGRTMTARNEKHIVKNVRVADFDAVSLYPSAMERLAGLPMGKPKPFIQNGHATKWKTADSYVVEIEITGVGKRYDFPLMTKVEENGLRTFTNDMIGEKMVVDKITLEDLIEYHKIEFNVIRGYYWDGGKNYKLKEVIRHLFNKRREEKAKGNPIQNVYKLLMNSAYGKTLLKPFDTETSYVKDEDFQDFVSRYYNYMVEAIAIYNTDPKRKEAFGDIKCWRVKKFTPIVEHFNNAICGVEILSMSKRIMMEVMTTAEDLNIPIYYTDTDSMHINEDGLPLLEKVYREKYGRELIGEDMGQFHTDFDLDGAKSETIIATESIFVGKKTYLDKLEGVCKKTGEKLVDYHIRCKGVPSKSIKHLEEMTGKSLIDIYKQMLNGEEVEFDLTCNGMAIKFDVKSSMEVFTKYDFKRKLNFGNEKKINYYGE